MQELCQFFACIRKSLNSELCGTNGLFSQLKLQVLSFALLCHRPFFIAILQCHFMFEIQKSHRNCDGSIAIGFIFDKSIMPAPICQHSGHLAALP